MGLDFHHFVRRGKSETAGNAIFKQFHVDILKLDDFFAIHANQMVVRGVFQKVGIVNFRLPSQIQFPEQTALHQQRKCPVNCCTGHGRIDLSRHNEEFFGIEMLRGAESGLDNGIPLRGFAQPFARKIAIQNFPYTLSGGSFHLRVRVMRTRHESRRGKGQRATAKESGVPLLHSCPGGVRPSPVHSPWRCKHRTPSRNGNRKCKDFVAFALAVVHPLSYSHFRSSNQYSSVMGKVLLYASIAVTLATTALGFINKGKLAASKEELASAQQQAQQKVAAAEQALKDLKSTKDSLATTTAEKEQVAAQTDSLKADLEKNKSQVSDLSTQVTAKEAQISELTAKIEAANSKIETLNASQTATPTGPSPELQAELQEKEALITKLQADLDSSRVQLEELRKKDSDRIAQKMRNGLEGRILAVNQAWNFVVLNLGDRNGVVGNAEMLIKRGNQLVGKLRVTSVEPSTSIADIVTNSVPRGINIQPGDNVIYQATAE